MEISLNCLPKHLQFKNCKNWTDFLFILLLPPKRCLVRRTWHVGWTFYLQIYTLVLTEQMLKTDACYIIHSGIIRGLVWMTPCATLAPRSAEASGNWREINSPPSNYNMITVFCNQGPSRGSVVNRESWDTLFLFTSYTTTSSPAGKLSALLLGLLDLSCCSFEPAKHSMQICKHHM